MITRAYFSSIFLVLVSVLVAFGHSRDELDGQASQVAADILATQTAEIRETTDRGTEVADQSTATGEAAIHADQTAEAEDRVATEDAAPDHFRR